MAGLIQDDKRPAAVTGLKLKHAEGGGVAAGSVILEMRRDAAAGGDHSTRRVTDNQVLLGRIPVQLVVAAERTALIELDIATGTARRTAAARRIERSAAHAQIGAERNLLEVAGAGGGAASEQDRYRAAILDFRERHRSIVDRPGGAAA